MTDYQGKRRRATLTTGERLDRWRIVGQWCGLVVLLLLAVLTLFARGWLQVTAAVTGPILGTAFVTYRLWRYQDR